jgi:adenylate cyclase class IV
LGKNNRTIYYQEPNNDGSLTQYSRRLRKKGKQKLFTFFIAPCHQTKIIPTAEQEQAKEQELAPITQRLIAENLPSYEIKPRRKKFNYSLI